MNFWSSQKLPDENEDKNYYHNLCNYSIEKCEFCDMVFSSRFANIIHNSSHIIIPLIKQNIHICKKCLFCFTSQAELKTHTEKKHKSKHDTFNDNTIVNSTVNCNSHCNGDLKPLTIKLNLTKLNIDNSIKKESPTEILTNKNTTSISKKKSTKKKKKTTKLKHEKREKEEEILGNLINNQPSSVLEENFTKRDTYSNKIEPTNDIIESGDNGMINTSVNNTFQFQLNRTDDCIAPILKRDSSPDVISIKSHSEFSDTEFNNTQDINNLLTNSTVNGILKVLSDDEDDSVPLNSQCNGLSLTSPVKLSNIRSMIQFEDDDLKLLDQELKNLSDEFKSVHHDELVEPLLSVCQRCYMVFQNRMELYKHELTHIKIRTRKCYYVCEICEKYYSGNHWSKKKHYKSFHPLADMKKFPVRLCKVCNLQYGIERKHLRKYHSNIYCDQCHVCFAAETSAKTHECPKSMSKMSIDKKPSTEILTVCELCFSFKKNTNYFKYELVGEKSEVGKRQKCVYCNNLYFDVKLVKKIKLPGAKFYQKKKPKEESKNQARLEKFRKRLKAIKTMNKF